MLLGLVSDIAGLFPPDGVAVAVTANLLSLAALCDQEAEPVQPDVTSDQLSKPEE